MCYCVRFFRQLFLLSPGSCPRIPLEQFNGSSKLAHISYACISDHKTHDTITVYSFLKHFHEHYASKEFPFLHKVFYFSDGSAAQYKNFKNLTNLIFHQNNFHIHAEWNSFATMERMPTIELVAPSKG